MLVWATLFGAGPAVAQDASGNDGTATLQLEPIQVQGAGVRSAVAPIDGYAAQRSRSATKTDTPLIETAQAVSVISAEQIADQSARSVSDVLHYVSGVVPELRGNITSRYTLVTLRGFSPDIYLDGLKLLGYYYAIPQVDPFLLERVEILKGPASVLYGQAPPGGIVNLVSKRPTEDQVNTYFAKIGSDYHAGLGFDVGGSLSDDGDVLYRVVAVGERRDGPQETVESSHFSLAPSLQFRLSDATELTLLGQYRRDPKGGAYGQLPAEGTVSPIPGFGRLPRDFYDGDTGFEQFEREQIRLGYEFSHWFNDSIQFRQHLRWNEIQIDYKSVFAVGLNDSKTALERNIAASTGTTNGLSVDNQILFYFDTGIVKHTLLAGLVYADLDGERRTGRPFPATVSDTPPLDISNPDHSQLITPPARTRFLFDQDQTGIYLQDQARIGDLTLIAGGRYDSIQTRQSSFPGGASATPVRESRTDQAFSARAGALYHFDNGVAPYVSYSESFQAPPVSGADVLEPTEGTQYEAGVKYRPPGSNVLVSSSLFHLTQSNVSTTDPAGFTTQTGEVQVQGVEFEVKASLRDGLDLAVAATWLDSEVTSAADGTEGNTFARTPAFTASLWLDYTVQDGAWRGLGAGLGIRHIGEQYARNANQLEVDAYTLLDATLHYALGGLSPAWDGWRVALNVKNLTDEKYVASCYAVTGCFYGHGRQTTATLSYRWR